MEIIVQLTIMLYIFGKAWDKVRSYETIGFDAFISAVTYVISGFSIVILITKTVVELF